MDNIFGDEFQELRHDVAKQLKGWMIGLGIIGIIVGVLLLVFPGKSAMALTLVLAAWLLVVGVVRVVSSFTVRGLPAGWRILDVLAGALLIVSAAIVARYSAAATGMLLLFASIMIGASWVMEGVLALFESALSANPGLTIFYGIVSIIGGIVVCFYPVTSIYLLIQIVAVFLIIYGIVALVRGIALRVPSKNNWIDV